MGVREPDLRAVTPPVCYTMGMRLALVPVLACLAGCPLAGNTSECQFDTDCGGDKVCGRDSQCHLSSEVRAVRAVWTLSGQKADATTCAATPDLYIQFQSAQDGDTLGYAPVPCYAGQFSMDKLPNRFTRVELGIDNGDGRQFADIDSDGIAAFDLVF